MIHFFSCTFTGNLRTSYIVILPIFQQCACAARSKRTPTKPPRAGGGGRGARKNINYVSFQGLLGLHIQQTHCWAFSHRNFQRNSISVQRAGINRKSSYSNSPSRLSRTATVHGSVWALCTLLIPWEAGFGYPSHSRAQLAAASLTAVLHLGSVTQPQANENKSDPHCERKAACHCHP